MLLLLLLQHLLLVGVPLPRHVLLLLLLLHLILLHGVLLHSVLLHSVLLLLLLELEEREGVWVGCEE
jgi:hypothetical protein